MTHAEAERFVKDCFSKRINFYKTYKWKAFRKQILSERINRCERCYAGGADGREAKVTKGILVLHHIQHLKDRPDLAFEPKNIQIVCLQCHNDLHPEKQNRGNYHAERWD